MSRKAKFDLKPLAAAIKEARESKGESRTVVGEAVGISASELMCIENRGQHPSVQVLYELVSRYGISVDKYFGVKTNAPAKRASALSEKSKKSSKTAAKSVTKKTDSKTIEKKPRATSAKPAVAKKATATTKATAKKPTVRKTVEKKNTAAIEKPAVKRGRKKKST